MKKNKLSISFKLGATIMSSMMESGAPPLCPTQDTNRPFVQGLLAVPLAC